MDEQLRNSANPSFRFVVEIDGIRQGAFTECTLPTVEWDIQEVKEGGLNSYVHLLPGMRKRATLTLKNGIGTGDLLQWCSDTLTSQFTRRAITVTLMNVQGDALINWHLEDAFPTKWTAPAFKSSDNAIAIQTIEFGCGEVRVEAA